jgi:hypothetical protein
MGYHFDYIPAGKKAVCVNGKWDLVDLDPKVQEDAVQLLEQARIRIVELEKENEHLKAEIEIFMIEQPEKAKGKPGRKVKESNEA